jgi:putative DNA primase/helicase
MARSQASAEFFEKGGVPYAGELLRNVEGNAKAILYNAVKALAKDKAFINGVGPAIRYDKFRCQTMIWAPLPWDENGILPRPWTDQDDREVNAWLQLNDITVGILVAGSAVQTVAERNQYHPVMEYLDSLVWDGVPRLDEWLINYCYVEDTPYVRAVGSRWMISAIARVNDPGCQVDCALILEGPQGIKKSTTFNILGGPFYTSDIAALGTTASQEQILGKWIVELDELQAVTRAADVAAVTSFITRRIDDFRLPYAHRSHKHPRQCVFGGTTNREIWMRDETGGRRWWPVYCPKMIDIDSLRWDRDQLWAEAVSRHNDGEVWFMDTPELEEAAKEEQEQRFEIDPWEEVLLTRLQEKSLSPSRGITLNQAFEALEVPMERRNRTEGGRLHAIIRHLKWDRRNVRDFNGQRVWKYFSVEN